LKDYLAAAVLLLSGPAFFLAAQANPSQHFGIGRWDRGWLAGHEGFYPPSRMEGPFRNPDGSVEVKEFVARLTKRDARLELPYHALRSPLEIRLRCHRFGLGGTVSLSVNEDPLGDFVFTESSYPWGGIEAVIPQAVAERGPLTIGLSTEGGREPPSHLPSDLGVGLDFVEVAPLSEGVVLIPIASQWAGGFLFLLSAFVFLRFLGAGPRARALGTLALAASLVAAAAFVPTIASRTIPVAWLVFPACMLLLWSLERVDRFTSGRELQQQEHE
jgi:hypothetical protein